jgi:hypothetical protein
MLITTHDQIHTVTLINTSFLIIHHVITINKHVNCFHWQKAEYSFLNRVESENGSTISGNEANAKAKNTKVTFYSGVTFKFGRLQFIFVQ